MRRASASRGGELRVVVGLGMCGVGVGVELGLTSDGMVVRLDLGPYLLESSRRTLVAVISRHSSKFYDPIDEYRPNGSKSVRIHPE
jgi:hypothetical protein